VPLTAGLVGKRLGTKHLATLFGMTFLSHQIGAFFGAWLGGLTSSRFGEFGWMWNVNIGLALPATLICMPIREPKLDPRSAPA
jgi:MFS family permease